MTDEQLGKHTRRAAKTRALPFQGETSETEFNAKIVFSPKVLNLMKKLNDLVRELEKEHQHPEDGKGLEEETHLIMRQLSSGKPVPVTSVIAGLSFVSWDIGRKHPHCTADVLSTIHKAMVDGDLKSHNPEALTVTVEPFKTKAWSL